MNIKDLTQIKGIIKEVVREEDLATKSDLKDFATKKDLQKIDKKFDKMIDFLDKDYLRVKRNVRDIQSHLHIPVSNF